MKFKVKVVKDVEVELNEDYYNEEFLSNVRGYWQDLDNYDDNETLEWLAEHIGYAVAMGGDISKIEGIHIDKNAHKAMSYNAYVEAERISS